MYGTHDVRREPARPDNNRLQRTALRAAAEPERWADHSTRWTAGL